MYELETILICLGLDFKDKVIETSAPTQSPASNIQSGYLKVAILNHTDETVS